jgi:glycosyltransferase involved in cell wall biosynthesis
LNILIVTGIFPPDHGGPASYVPYIAQALIDESHDVKVITLSDSIEPQETYAFQLKRIRRKGLWFLRAIRTIFSIYKAAKKADVVYLNGLVLEGVVACKFLSNKPVVVKVVGDLIWEKARNGGKTTLTLDEFQKDKLPFNLSFLRWLQSFYMRRADYIIVPSDYLRNLVKFWAVNPERICLVYNAVKLQNLDLESAPKQFDLVTVARLVPWKGVADLIEVAGELGLRLLVVGDGPMRSELEEIASKTKTEVVFMGNIPKSQVPQAIRQAKLFVLNSSYEGLPHIVLEAKLTRTPVMATNAGGTRETINHNFDGWLVSVGDKTELKMSISKVISDQKLIDKIALNGLKQVSRDFSSETQISKTIDILRLAINNPKYKSVNKSVDSI